MSDKKSFDAIDRKTRQSRKKREAALILPITGIVLLTTPILDAFIVNHETSELIDTLLFIFGIWAGLIIAAFCMARVLVSETREK